MKKGIVLIGCFVGFLWGNTSSANICEGHCQAFAPDPNQQDAAALCFCDAVCSGVDMQDCCQNDAGTKGADGAYVDAACGNQAENLAPPAPPPPPAAPQPPEPPPAVAGTIGNACTQNSDCGADVLCATAEQGFQDGYCYILGCSVNSCPVGSGCVGLKGGSVEEVYAHSLCLAQCNSDDDCRDNYQCDGLGVWAFGLCEPKVGSYTKLKALTEGDQENPVPSKDGEAAETEPEKASGTVPVGGPCVQSSDCVGDPDRAVCSTEDEGPIDGYCTIIDCSAAADCPVGSGCFRLSNGVEDDQYACLAFCKSDGDCREHYQCRDQSCLPKEMPGNYSVVLIAKGTADMGGGSAGTGNAKEQDDAQGSSKGGGCSLIR